ncbi:macrolide transporter [Chania multitudinisentens RB-25]|uniref:Macrolide transporter n=1 Tax=Chania multitudinisentens RB-25 TaxID=1441930 RepID=W0LHP5_9GAMM|nr:macrolide transporter subunit MacA [Chania multitudinisentens]AHG21934.1 macrolide transporter [Chania multitudinisentens RB-25]
MWLIRRKKRWVISLVVLAVIAVIAYWRLNHPAPVVFKTVKVAQRELQQNVLATGQLDAVRKVDVGAQVSGQLESLKVEIGDRVEKGQLLGIIDPQQAQNSIREGEATLQELQAQLRQTQAEQQLAAVTLQRNRELANKQAVSRQDLDKYATELAVKEAQVETIRAQIMRNQASLDTARINLAYTRIEAPMAGEVVQITTLQGQTVIAAQQAPNILTLADMSTMLVKAQVSEADVINLKPGQKAWFTVLGDPNKRFDGVLKDIQPTPEKVNNAIFYYARFEVPNPEGLLRLQMTAQVHIQLSGVSDALVIPLAALGEQVADNRYHVAVLQQGQEQQREVTIGIRNNIDVQIVSGLALGEEVIISRGGAGEN